LDEQNDNDPVIELRSIVMSVWIWQGCPFLLSLLVLQSLVQGIFFASGITCLVYAWSQVGHGADKTIGNWIGSKESFSPLLVPREWSFWTGAA
jgi:hypothetical protein